jgi:hypothetical protein
MQLERLTWDEQALLSEDDRMRYQQWIADHINGRGVLELDEPAPQAELRQWHDLVAAARQVAALDRPPVAVTTTIAETLTGPRGTAQRILLPPLERPHATLATWFLHLPGAHPVWSRYLLSLVHLRSHPDLPTPHHRDAAVGYELVLVALNPQIDPTPGDLWSWQPLEPWNIVEQFGSLDDAGAVVLSRHVALELVEGRLWADPTGVRGAREHWQQVIAALVVEVQGAAR